MKCLVTGGAGFIGSNLAQRLCKLNYEVTIVDDLSAGESVFIPSKTHFIQEDFSNPKILKLVKSKAFDIVYHLAAKPKVEFSVNHPAATTYTNVMKTVVLMEACIGSFQRFVNTSSSSVYGDANLPTTEINLHNPKSPYALQKSTIENFCKMFSDIYGLDTVSIRPFNVFGPHQLGSGSYSCAISAWLESIKNDKPCRFDGDGNQRRDLIYVDNVVDLFILAGEYHLPMKGSAFNAGSGISYSNNEILRKLRHLHPNLKIQHAPARKNDVKATLASMQRAKLVLGWREKISLDQGLHLTNDWYMQSPIQQ